jgi:hypothetical protein
MSHLVYGYNYKESISAVLNLVVFLKRTESPFFLKRSDCSIRGGRGILDLDGKDTCGWGQQQAGGWVHLLAAGAAILVMETLPGDRNINDNVK